ncbi:MAG: arginine repressor [Limnochordia bacterium]
MKRRRHEAIRRIIAERIVTTQDELAQALAAEGIEVTQATVSRDIRELSLVKVPDGSVYRYAEPLSPTTDALGRARRNFAEFVVDIERSGTLLVVKTTPGSANAVAASIDEVEFRDIAATLAGDDVILIVVREPKDADKHRDAALALEAELYRLWGRPMK